MDQKKCYKRSSGFVFRLIDDEALLVPIVKTTEEVDCIYTLSPVGAKIWNGMDGKTSIEKIIKSIAGEYKIDEKLAKKDVSDFLDQLLEIGSIT